MPGFLDDVLEGLSREQKQIPCKYFYDAEGARLFHAICETPEYYPTRTEIGMMHESAGEMASLLGAGCLLVEYGSGRSVKTRLLLEHMDRPAGYVPIDISSEQLHESAEGLRQAFPDLTVLPVLGDYTTDLTLPDCPNPVTRRVVYFPGSTIGNFPPPEARDFLRGCARLAGDGGGILIGVDLKKDRAVLEAAYDDAAGITAAFNKNLLVRMNLELGANLDLEAWQHRAPWVEEEGRIEMHLVSRHAQTVEVGGKTFRFVEGEFLLTEYSYKYTVEEFRDLLENSGFRPERTWVDPARLFSVHYAVRSI